MKLIAVGSMLTEGVVSILALIAATSLLPLDYFQINVPVEKFQAILPRLQEMGYTQSNLSQLSAEVGEKIAGRTGGAVSLGVGMAYIFSSIPGMKSLMSYWYHFAIMFEALFILTTVDTGTRVARYILQEMFKPVSAKLASSTYLPGVILSGIIISFLWGYLVYNGDVSSIWPMFGVANQLLATLALSIGTIFILQHSGKWYYSLMTFLPSVFMFATTFTAGIENITGNYLPKHTFQGNLNAGLTVVMLILVVVIFFESTRKCVGYLTAPQALPELAADPETDIEE
ncbi:MAG TPA: carbon starvation CstA 5TM domain-containing protein, partial [Terriglobales bacterium]|nr:carbon starvation CstA 5TM domain-containing protein [Terriglobales bacterium]